MTTGAWSPVISFIVYTLVLASSENRIGIWYGLGLSCRTRTYRRERAESGPAHFVTTYRYKYGGGSKTLIVPPPYPSSTQGLQQPAKKCLNPGRQTVLLVKGRMSGKLLCLLSRPKGVRWPTYYIGLSLMMLQLHLQYVMSYSPSSSHSFHSVTDFLKIKPIVNMGQGFL